MLKSGKEYLQSLRDGRVVYLGDEKIDDVTSHPAFRNAARTVADIYDMKAADDRLISSDGRDRYSAYYLRAANKDDLRQRTQTHRAIADMTYGLFGRSPDHVASFVAGMATNLAAFGQYADNLVAYYDHMRRHDIYAVYAIIPPQASRHGDFYAGRNLPMPALHVVREEDDGVVLSGTKVLATGAVLANEIWIGNITPLAPNQGAEAITCAVPVNSPGLALWSRQSFERVAGPVDNPLAYAFDETDSILLCTEVKVPWQRVFVHNDVGRARGIYLETAGHCYGNHQSNVRFWSKLRFLAGLARRVAEATGADQQSATKEALGGLAAKEALIGGLIMGQIEAAENWPQGHITYNRRIMYSALQWCTEHYACIIDMLRDISSSHVFQMPAHSAALGHPVLGPQFDRLFLTPQLSARQRMRLFKLVWDIIGSEFAGRHQQYEKFYAGAPAVVRNYNFMHAPWSELDAAVSRLVDEDQSLSTMAV